MEIKKESLLFFLGFLSCAIIFYMLFFVQNSYSLTVFALKNTEVPAPNGIISSEDIVILKDRIIIHIPNTSLTFYEDTGSMKPVLDERSKGIRIRPSNESQIHIGDIISFRRKDILIVHRVIEKGEDNLGTYFVTKGDNNEFKDGKIRFEDIEYLTIAILW
jgi:signal peptidase I